MVEVGVAVTAAVDIMVVDITAGAASMVVVVVFMAAAAASTAVVVVSMADIVNGVRLEIGFSMRSSIYAG